MAIAETDVGRAAPTSSASPTNQVVSGRYRLLAQLGAGGMGSVYEAEEVRLGRRFAIKLLRGDLRGGKRSEERLQREARALARLEHENIVSLFEVGYDDLRGHYLVLERVRGQTLRHELTTLGVRPPSRMLEIVQQVARALEHAHAAGVVHRDLKPENIMLSAHADGSLLVKLLDFGVARLLDDVEQERLTATGDGIGTAPYMAPEQARGESTLSAGTDVFALGVIIYECLAGQRPYQGSSYNETLFLILNRPHEPLTQLRPDLPPALSKVVERALAKQASERFKTIDELWSALRLAAEASCAPLSNEPGLDTADLLTPHAAAPSRRATAPRPITKSLALAALVGAGVSLLLVQLRSLHPTSQAGAPSAAVPFFGPSAPSSIGAPATSFAPAPSPEPVNAPLHPSALRSSGAARRSIPASSSSARADDPLKLRGYELKSPYD